MPSAHSYLIFLRKAILVCHAIELFNTEQVELVWQISFQDTLSQQIGIALKNVSATASYPKHLG
ncbi:hypothetical protein [Microcoleus sp. Pol12A5]|uniref:hypothetical protein n=1 Tax=Microcoleus sp. Pol12A5 TaxID=3055392 RepID=UPI002FCFC9CD